MHKSVINRSLLLIIIVEFCSGKYVPTGDEYPSIGMSKSGRKTMTDTLLERYFPLYQGNVIPGQITNYTIYPKQFASQSAFLKPSDNMKPMIEFLAGYENPKNINLSQIFSDAADNEQEAGRMNAMDIAPRFFMKKLLKGAQILFRIILWVVRFVADVLWNLSTKWGTPEPTPQDTANDIHRLRLSNSDKIQPRLYYQILYALTHCARNLSRALANETLSSMIPNPLLPNASPKERFEFMMRMAGEIRLCVRYNLESVFAGEHASSDVLEGRLFGFIADVVDSLKTSFVSNLDKVLADQMTSSDSFQSNEPLQGRIFGFIADVVSSLRTNFVNNLDKVLADQVTSSDSSLPNEPLQGRILGFIANVIDSFKISFIANLDKLFSDGETSSDSFMSKEPLKGRTFSFIADVIDGFKTSFIANLDKVLADDVTSSDSFLPKEPIGGRIFGFITDVVDSIKSSFVTNLDKVLADVEQ